MSGSFETEGIPYAKLNSTKLGNNLLHCDRKYSRTRSQCCLFQAECRKWREPNSCDAVGYTTSVGLRAGRQAAIRISIRSKPQDGNTSELGIRWRRPPD